MWTSVVQVPLVRVMENNRDLIKRFMDAGSHGVVVPLVNSKKDAEKAVSAVKYTPVGTRGVGLRRAQFYSLDFEIYRKWNQENSVVIVQIEHINAVENLEAIMSTDCVDGFIIGLYDLSGSMGCPGNFEDSRVPIDFCILSQSLAHCPNLGGHLSLPVCPTSPY